MTSEEKDLKDLLTQDLCGRLPYGVKIETEYFTKATLVTIRKNISYGAGKDLLVTYDISGEETPYQSEERSSTISKIKPYLFPLSSMTDEQCEELNNLIHEHFILDDGFNEGVCFKTYGDILVWLDEKPINECYFIFDYFNKNHFDYRDLIKMGLANDATGLNIY